MKKLTAIVLTLIMVISAAPAFAAQIVKIICGYGVGGTADLVARQFANTANNLRTITLLSFRT